MMTTTLVERVEYLTYTPRDLQRLAALNPRHRSSEQLLLGFFDFIKRAWTAGAFRTFQQQTGLRLTSNLNRCEFARRAAIEELRHATPTADFSEYDREQFRARLEAQIGSMRQRLTFAQEKAHQLELALESEKRRLSASANLTLLLIAERLLPPGDPLNGSQESPAMRVLGSPATLTELEANYRELLKREHPDVSVHPTELAQARFAYVRRLYQIVRRNWEKLRPTAAIADNELERRLRAPVPFDPASFWPA
ncbi:J domain-containing protein [Rubidibacter lacunae]|nr:J domain-containing protein [Rubidibacter lacunae]